MPSGLRTATRWPSRTYWCTRVTGTPSTSATCGNVIRSMRPSLPRLSAFPASEQGVGPHLRVDRTAQPLEGGDQVRGERGAPIRRQAQVIAVGLHRRHPVCGRVAVLPLIGTRLDRGEAAARLELRGVPTVALARPSADH